MKRLRSNVEDETQAWLDRIPNISSDSELLQRAMDRSFRDLRILRSTLGKEMYFAAGVPWFATLFGRDSLITAIQTLAYNSSIAEHTLRLLALYQGEKEDEWRDEAPGKILHEYRVGELARLGRIPYTPYYGTVDATPLFLILVGLYTRWTGDLKLFDALRPNVERALIWMAQYGDRNGDGYLEYDAKPSGEAGSDMARLVNKGWKDSGNAIVNEDGSLATSPIALVEVQGYAYLAKRLIADLFERTGDSDHAKQLRREADTLQIRFNREFWLDGKGVYALALQKGGRSAAVVSSNPGHALWAGIAEPEKARLTAARLMDNDMFSGWGVRTLASSERGFNPIGYHLGTVWPHDNSIIAAGFRRYGHDESATRIFEGLVHAASHFDDDQLPELFCGFARGTYPTPVRYPVACHPQAWAAGSIPYLLSTMLGLEADAFDQRLRVHRPVLPAFITHLEIHGVRVGQARADLRFERRKDSVNVIPLKTHGRLDIVVEQS